MRLPPTPCRVCFRPCVFNKFSHFWQNYPCETNRRVVTQVFFPFRARIGKRKCHGEEQTTPSWRGQMILISLATAPRASSSVWRERMRAQRHIRPHVNPLQRRFQLPAALDLEGQIAFARPQPVHMDIGCGKGHFCADLAEARPDLNVLGIEIRDPLVEEANRLCMPHSARTLADVRPHSPHAMARGRSATHTLEPRLGQASSRAPATFASWRAAPMCASALTLAP